MKNISSGLMRDNIFCGEGRQLDLPEKIIFSLFPWPLPYENEVDQKEYHGEKTEAV
jgi:hypothetical protein